ncbi:uncharacterized protein LOC135486214 [Lineus longissimus]|uniref:uncharacterized protein LOC135486214 n=1 Tax=Lineus longissimus TaxID=88925 RepID=UPI00315C6B7D
MSGTNNHKTVKLHHGEVEVCQQYQKTFSCSSYNCDKLHICTAYLAGQCQFGSHCKRYHSCRVSLNRSIIERLRLDSIGCIENLREIFNHVLPKLCLDYQNKDGCRRGDRCHFLHICGKYARGNCTNMACEMSHEYRTGPNRKLLDYHAIDVRGEACLLNAILADGRFSKGVVRCSCLQSERYTSQDSLTSEGDYEGGYQANDQGRGGRGRGQDRGRGRGYRGGQMRSGSHTRLDEIGRGQRGGRDIRGGPGDHNRGRSGGRGHHDDWRDPRGRGQHQGGDNRNWESGSDQGRGGRGQPHRGQSHDGRGRSGYRGGHNDDRRGMNDNDFYRGSNLDLNCLSREDSGRRGDQGNRGRGQGGRGRLDQNRRRGQGGGQEYNRSNLGSATNLGNCGDEDCRGNKQGRSRKRRGRGRKNLNQIQASERKSEVSSDSNNEAYSGDEDVDSETDLYTSNIDMQNVKQDIRIKEDDMKDLKGLIQMAKANASNAGASSDKKLNIDGDDSEVMEAIIGYLCQHGGWVKFAEMRRDPDLEHALLPYKMDLQEHLFRKGSSFILNQHDNGHLLDVAPIVSVRICFNYNSETGCDNSKECGYLNVCKDFIAGTCPKQCRHNPKRNHHLQEGGTRALLTKHKLDKLKANVCCRVIASTLPRICYDYNNSGCNRPQSCPWLHICEAHFLEGNCSKKGPNCNNHDIKNIRCQKILKRYHLAQETNALLRRMVLPGCPSEAQADGQEREHSTPRKDDTKSGVRPKSKRDGDQRSGGNDDVLHVNRAAEDQLKQDGNKGGKGRKRSNQRNDAPLTVDPQLCEPFLRRACKKSCSDRHHSLPYLWQFQVDGNWEDFPDELNIGIEMEFCSVNSGRWSSNITFSDSERFGLPFCGRTDIVFQKKPMELHSWQYSGPGDLTENSMNCPVRRLSTLSHVLAECFKTLATVWKWYYYLGDTWHSNEEDNSNQAYVVEQRYIKNDPTYTFRDERMCLNFNEMVLKHIDTGAVVGVRRRPVFISKDDVAEKLRAATAKLTLPQLQEQKSTSIYPDYWSEMDDDASVKFVTLGQGREFAEIEQSFKRSMGTVAAIQSIRRIQNADLWEGFITQKKVIQTDKSKKLDEKYYFYICEPDMVDFVDKYGIITSSITGSGSPVQDLGTGFYFAKDARLLHEVAKFRPDECVMFLCKILIGSRQVGPIGDAYSKVVYDTFTTPDEAVILKVENQQCYPEYVICYKVVEAERPPPYSPTVASNVPPAYTTSAPLAYPHPDYLAHIPQARSQPTAPSASQQPTLIPLQRFEASAGIGQMSISSDSSVSDMYQSGQYRPYPGLTAEQVYDPQMQRSTRPRLYPKLPSSGQEKTSSKDQCSMQ